MEKLHTMGIVCSLYLLFKGSRLDRVATPSFEKYYRLCFVGVGGFWDG